MDILAIDNLFVGLIELIVLLGKYNGIGVVSVVRRWWKTDSLPRIACNIVRLAESSAEIQLKTTSNK